MTERVDITGRVEQLLDAPIRAIGCRLLEVQFHEGGAAVLRLLVDREPAVSLEDLSAISELAGRILDVEDPIPQAYSLEVSSPGLFRPLREARHFEQSIGKLARVTMASDILPEHRQRTVRGIIRKVEDEIVHLEVAEEILQMPVSGLRSAKLDPDL